MFLSQKRAEGSGAQRGRGTNTLGVWFDLERQLRTSVDGSSPPRKDGIMRQKKRGICTAIVMKKGLQFDLVGDQLDIMSICCCYKGKTEKTLGTYVRWLHVLDTEFANLIG